MFSDTAGTVSALSWGSGIPPRDLARGSIDNMFGYQSIRQKSPKVPPAENGTRALGLKSEVGSITDLRRRIRRGLPHSALGHVVNGRRFMRFGASGRASAAHAGFPSMRSRH